MAVLDPLKIPELLQKRQKNQEIEDSIRHDKRVVFHTEPTQRAYQIPYIREYLDWIGQIIDHRKHDVFEHLLTMPIETIEFTEGVFNELKKIFNAPDRFKQHNFTNPELVKDYETYLDLIHNDEFWKTKGFQAMKSAINSILIVDLPAIQGPSDRPEPYYYLLPIDNVKIIKIGDNMRVEYIVFKDIEKEDVYHVFDDLFYRTYVLDKGNYILTVESQHDLGYTPARSFWSTPFNMNAKIQKKGPITNSLTQLDWLLAEYTFIKHEELYAGFPIDIMYEQQSPYTDDDGDSYDYNQTGINTLVPTSLYNDEDTTQAHRRYPSPESNTNKPVLGPGTQLLAPLRADKDDPDMINGLNRISADVASLNWIVDKIEKAEKKITFNMIGFTQDQSREAMNEMQVMGNVQSRENVVIDVKTNFENAETFVVKTMGFLRYGQAYLGSKIFYGEKFFFQSLDSIREGIKLSKTIGMPNFEIASQQKQLLNTKYQNNGKMLSKIEILMQLEPYQGYSLEELLTLNNSFRLDPVKMTIKTNFPEYIRRFENEFTNILTFMEFVELPEKVAVIYAILERYANEELNRQDQEGNQEGFTQPANDADSQRGQQNTGE